MLLSCNYAFYEKLWKRIVSMKKRTFFFFILVHSNLSFLLQLVEKTLLDLHATDFDYETFLNLLSLDCQCDHSYVALNVYC